MDSEVHIFRMSLKKDIMIINNQLDITLNTNLLNRMYLHQTNIMGNGKITDFDDTWVG